MRFVHTADWQIGMKAAHVGRLALAELLTKDAGQRRLVVLDDVLTATDDERMNRVFVILEEMRPHAQFLILTCHPERYRLLTSANFIDMESLRS